MTWPLDDGLFGTIRPELAKLSPEDRGRLAARVLACGAIDEPSIRAFFGALSGEQVDSFLEMQFNLDGAGG
jgi:hypothetical protein